MRNKCIYIIALFISISLFECYGKDCDKTIWLNDSLWYHSTDEYNTENIDVLYFASTEVLSAKDKMGNTVWQSQLIPSDITAIKGEMEWVNKNIFYENFNMYAPFYHQYTFESIKLDSIHFDTVYAKVSKEACEAFDYYMEHFNNNRPFILAGFSQGAMLTLDILRHMTDEQFEKMIVCYAIGYRLSAKDIEHPHIKPAQGECDKGVVVSFNSVQSREGIWKFVASDAATCINPINWKTDSTPTNFTFDGTKNEIHIDQQTNVLIVKTDSPSYYYDFYKKAPVFLELGVNPDNLHHWDLFFYTKNIHDNALIRR